MKLLCSLQSSGGGRAPGTRPGAAQEEVRQAAGEVLHAVTQEELLEELLADEEELLEDVEELLEELLEKI